MYFCIRDDDTSFFTSPEDLERAYGTIKGKGCVSLAIVPFFRAGPSKGVPEKFRNRWTVHALHENVSLVSYLRQEIAEGRFEAMLHGYYHDERNGTPEFTASQHLDRKVLDGRKYLEDLSHLTIQSDITVCARSTVQVFTWEELRECERDGRSIPFQPGRLGSR